MVLEIVVSLSILKKKLKRRGLKKIGRQLEISDIFRIREREREKKRSF